MNKNKPIVLLLIDAFRHDYLNEEDTPFLYNCAKNGQHFEKIIPANGFCERSEIFTGKSIFEMGFFSAISFDPKKSMYAKISNVLDLLQNFNFLFKSVFFNKVCRRLLWMWSCRQQHPMSPNQIPFSLLKYFILTEDYNDMVAQNALPFISIFDLLKDKNKTFCRNSFTSLFTSQQGDDSFRLKLVLNSDKKKDFYLVYLSNMDTVGHIYGPDSKEMKKALKEMDKKLSRFVSEFQKDCPLSEFVFLGDHGMLPVQKNINILSILNKIIEKKRFVLGKDYVFFLDSTIFRFWFLRSHAENENIKDQILNNSDLIKNGTFIDQNNMEQYKIPIGKKHGDLIWWANPGVLISPDFFNKGKNNVRGMHGYLNTLEESKGMAILYGNDVPKTKINEMHLTGIFTLLRERLKI